MAPKKKGEKEEKVDPERRPPGPTDRALEQVRAEVEVKTLEVEELERKLKENTERLVVIKEWEDRLPRLDEQLRRTHARFRRCLQPERPESATSGVSRSPGLSPQHRSSDGLVIVPLKGPDAAALRELQSEAGDALLSLLTFYYKKPRTRREIAERERLQAEAQSEAASGGRRQSVKQKDKPKGGKGEEELPPTGPDMELRCPIGISTEVFDRVLRSRLERLQLEEDIEKTKEDLKPLRDLVQQVRNEGVSKQQFARANRAYKALREKKSELEFKVALEDEEWKAKRDEEAKERATTSESAKRPGSAPKKK